MQNNGRHLNSQLCHLIRVVGITACDRLDGWGFETWGHEIFHTCTDQPQGFPNILYNGYWGSFPGVKQPECGTDHPSTSSAEVMNGCLLVNVTVIVLAGLAQAPALRTCHHQFRMTALPQTRMMSA